MYLRPVFTETDPRRIRAMIRAHPFGLLVTAEGGLDASHLPFALFEEGDGFVLCGHLAAANAQCAALDGGEALVVFSGPHAYISPGWYEAQPSVPTWDYVAVHVHGVLRPVTDDARMATDLDAMLPEGEAFRVGALPEGYRARMFAGIRAFKLTPTRVEAQWKMSQNRSTADRLNVASGLRAEGMDDVAALVEATLG